MIGPNLTIFEHKIFWKNSMANQVFVGYDTREDIAYQVCEYSIKRYDSGIKIVPLVQQELRQKKIYWREIRNFQTC